MTRIDTLAIRFLKNPASLRYREIERVLLYIGFEKIQTKGSHTKFKHQTLSSDLIIPVHKGECKKIYKRIAANMAKVVLNNNVNEHEDT